MQDPALMSLSSLLKPGITLNRLGANREVGELIVQCNPTPVVAARHLAYTLERHLY